MPPQTPTPISSPSPNPQYDFILRDPQKPKHSFGLPGLPSNMPKPMLLLVGVVGILLIIVIFGVIFKGGGGNSQNLIAVAGRAQEIARISTLVQQQSQDPNTQYLAATTQITLASEQYQLTTYLSKHNVKVSPAQLNAYQNKNTDTQLQTAAQNNNLGSTYDAYLKNNLATYQSDIRGAAKGASKSLLAILNSANTSAGVLLAAPEITSLPSGS
jgi:hypothetical protein